MAKPATTLASEEKVKVNRREFLNLAWLASMGFILADVTGVTLLFAFPRFKPGEFGGVFPLNVSTLPEIGEAPVANAKGKFWLTRTDEGIRAIYKVCTHLGCLYNWQDQEQIFICPCHGSKFEYDGSYITGPAPRALDVFAIKFVDSATGDEISAVTEDASKALPIPDNPDAMLMVDTGNKIDGAPNA